MSDRRGVAQKSPVGSGSRTEFENREAREVLLPSDNEWGIPMLDLSMQGQVVPPVIAWGSHARGVQMLGTWTFYCDDYRFTALLKRPMQLPATGCNCAVEPNITLLEHTPRAFAIWATYQKRHVARQWQDAGVSVIVDLNVPARLRDICLLGVPAGWRSFATRGYACRIQDLESEHEFARSLSPLATLMVFGGGLPVEEACRGLVGAVYVPAHMDGRRGKG